MFAESTLEDGQALAECIVTMIGYGRERRPRIMKSRLVLVRDGGCEDQV